MVPDCKELNQLLLLLNLVNFRELLVVLVHTEPTVRIHPTRKGGINLAGDYHRSTSLVDSGLELRNPVSREDPTQLDLFQARQGTGEEHEVRHCMIFDLPKIGARRNHQVAEVETQRDLPDVRARRLHEQGLELCSHRMRTLIHPRRDEFKGEFLVAGRLPVAGGRDESLGCHATEERCAESKVGLGENNRTGLFGHLLASHQEAGVVADTTFEDAKVAKAISESD